MSSPAPVRWAVTAHDVAVAGGGATAVGPAVPLPGPPNLADPVSGGVGRVVVVQLSVASTGAGGVITVDLALGHSRLDGRTPQRTIIATGGPSHALELPVQSGAWLQGVCAAGGAAGTLHLEWRVGILWLPTWSSAP